MNIQNLNTEAQLILLFSDAINVFMKAHEFDNLRDELKESKIDVIPLMSKVIRSAIAFMQDNVWSLEARKDGMLIILFKEVKKNSIMPLPHLISEYNSKIIDQIIKDEDFAGPLGYKDEFAILCKLYDFFGRIQDHKNIDERLHYSMIMSTAKVNEMWSNNELSKFLNEESVIEKARYKPKVLEFSKDLLYTIGLNLVSILCWLFINLEFENEIHG